MSQPGTWKGIVYLYAVLQTRKVFAIVRKPLCWIRPNLQQPFHDREALIVWNFLRKKTCLNC